MASRYEICRNAFAERVLPHFPEAKERFKRYFRESYALIRSLPLSIGSKEDLRVSKNRVVSLTNVYLNMDIAWTALGIKPLSTAEGSPEHAHHDWLKKSGTVELIHAAGLDFAIGQTWKEVLIFSPILVAEPLSRMLNRNITPEVAKATLQEINRHKSDFTHDMMGFPEAFRGGWSPFGLRVQSFGRLSESEFLSSHVACAVYHEHVAKAHLQAWAHAAAIVDEIRQHPLSIFAKSVYSYHHLSFRIRSFFFPKYFISPKHYSERDSVIVSRNSTSDIDWLVKHRNGS
jgi:hypothetical protein